MIRHNLVTGAKGWIIHQMVPTQLVISGKNIHTSVPQNVSLISYTRNKFQMEPKIQSFLKKKKKESEEKRNLSKLKSEDFFVFKKCRKVSSQSSSHSHASVLMYY